MKMTTLIYNTIFFIAVLCSTFSFGQDAKYSALINTDSVKFRVGEPTGYMSDLDNAAQFSANVVLYTNMDNVNKGDAIIQVAAITKKDVDSGKEMEKELVQYREDYPTLKEKQLITSHKTYKCFSTFIAVNGQFYRYITYVNPGDTAKKIFTVIMNLPKREATPAELEAYRKIVESLEIL